MKFGCCRSNGRWYFPFHECETRGDEVAVDHLRVGLGHETVVGAVVARLVMLDAREPEPSLSVNSA